MHIHVIKKIPSAILVAAFLGPSFSGAADIDLQDLALPSEVRDIGKSSGAVFYSPTTKNKTLMPVHIWGEVHRPGLHYIPVDTKLIKGLSFAGGGNGSADLSEVVVNRLEEGGLQRREFNLVDGGDGAAHAYTLRPGDTVFVEKDRFPENRAYYTGLFGVVLTIVSTLLVLKRLEDSQ
jgi:hypothetical protein